MGVVAKMFIQSESVGPEPGSLSLFTLGAVCRGEINKDWAAATPSGQATIVDQVLTDVWAAKRSGARADAEVYVKTIFDPDGSWRMDSCSFSYGGCQITAHHNGQPYGQKLSMTVNASPATKVLRQAFADGLLTGEAPHFRVEIEDASGDA